MTRTTSVIYSRLLTTIVLVTASSSDQHSAAGFCTRPLPCTPALVQHNGIRLASNYYYNLHRRSAQRQLSMNDEDEAGKSDVATNADGSTKREGYTWEELSADPELQKIEFNSSMNRQNSLLLPQRISRAITTLAWLFVAGGIVLNQLGLAYVKDPSGGIGIGSLDERDFQVEVIKEGRRMKKAKNEKGTTVSIAPKTGPYNHIVSWTRQNYGDELI